jgi:hypothetical protein
VKKSKRCIPEVISEVIPICCCCFFFFFVNFLPIFVNELTVSLNRYLGYV